MQAIRTAKSLLRKSLMNIFKEEAYDQVHFQVNSKTTRSEYERLAKACQEQTFPVIDEWEMETGYAISKSWLDNLALLTQVTIKKSELNYQHGRVIYSTLRNYIQEKTWSKIKILEIGTAKGFSSICMSKALVDANAEGCIISIDPLPHNIKMYWNCVADIDGQSTRKELLGEYQEELTNIIFLQDHSPGCLSKLGVDRINFAFVDGMHKYANIVNEYTYIKEQQMLGDIIIFDDIQTAAYSDVGNFVKDVEASGEYSLREIWTAETRGYAVMTKL